MRPKRHSPVSTATNTRCSPARSGKHRCGHRHARVRPVHGCVLRRRVHRAVVVCRPPLPGNRSASRRSGARCDRTRRGVRGAVLRLPGQPPAVGDDNTIGDRSGAYLTITLVSVIAAIAAVTLALWLRPRLRWPGVGYRGGDPVPDGRHDRGRIAARVPRGLRRSRTTPATSCSRFPGGVIGDFRVYVIANQVILWTVLTTVFALIIWKLGSRALR